MQQARTRAEFKRANDELQAYNEELKRGEREEEKRIEGYAVRKERMEQLRKDKERQKFEEKQETRQRLIEKQAEHLKTIKNREDEILSKQVQEAQEKADRMFEEEQVKR